MTSSAAPSPLVLRKNGTTRLLKIPLALLIATVVAACSSLSQGFVYRDDIKFDVGEADPVQITRATAYSGQGVTEIRGQAQFLTRLELRTFKGHIYVNIEMPDGTPVEQHNIEPVPNRIPKKRGRPGFFLARIPIDLPDKAIIELRYREGAHAKS